MDFSPEQAQRRVNNFFAKCRIVWGAGAFNQQFGTEVDLRLAKQEFFEAICKPTDEELHMAFEHAKRMIAEGNPDWRYPHPERILAGAKRYQSAAHKPFLPAPERELLPKEELGRRARALLDELNEKNSKRANP